MRLSKLSRTHLVYQFIILTLILLWVAHNEFLIDKKYVVLLGLVPVFLYQMVTISWCSELLPESQRSCLSEVLFGTTTESGEDRGKEQTEKIQESKDPKKDPECPENAGESTQRTPPVDNKQRTYKFRGWQRSPNGTSTPCPPPHFDATEAEKTFPRFTWSSDENKQESSELTKRYYFPYRQKRPEEWIDSNNGLKRPCKIKPRVSNIDERDEEQHCQATADDDGERSEEASVMRGSPKIKKSYTFPRQTRREEKTEEIDYPVVGMPLIPNKEYMAEARNKTRRRRSVSISHLKTEQEQLNYEKQHEFISQSVEISRPSLEFNKSPARSGVSKVKTGFLSYFSKIRKESNDTKASCTTVKKRMKSLWQSRESLRMPGGSEGGRSRKSVTDGDNEGFTYYPGYSLFDSDPFDKKECRKDPLVVK